jgi:hypothetical protein
MTEEMDVRTTIDLTPLFRPVIDLSQVRDMLDAAGGWDGVELEEEDRFESKPHANPKRSPRTGRARRALQHKLGAKQPS